MRHRTTLTGALAVAAGLAAAPAALAADQTVQAVDAGNVWSPSSVTIDPGDTVTWSFAGSSVPHNVASDSDNWNLPPSEIHVGEGSESFTFAAPGAYRFVCKVHPTTMWGYVNVTGPGGEPPPPPPPPPPGKEPFPNEWESDGRFESGGLDRRRPRLRRVRIRGIRNGARVRFRASERAVVKVRVKMYGVTLKTKRVRVGEGRRRTVRVRGPFRRGRYRVVVRAVDPAGNRSRRHGRTVYFR